MRFVLINIRRNKQALCKDQLINCEIIGSVAFDKLLRTISKKDMSHGSMLQSMPPLIKIQR